MLVCPCQLTTSTVPPIPEPIGCQAIEAGNGQRLFLVICSSWAATSGTLSSPGKAKTSANRPAGWLDNALADLDDRAERPALDRLHAALLEHHGVAGDLSLPADHARVVARQYGCRRSTASASARWW